MLTSHKIALDPTQAQATYFAKGCGVARVAWNWALEEWRRQYQAGEQPSEAALRRQLNSLKKAVKLASVKQELGHVLCGHG